jgi:hypothetical protein
MRNHVRFRSAEFSPRDREPGRVDSERYGYALASWLSARLSERGVKVEVPVAEDWGWFIDADHDGRLARLGCGNVHGSITEWLIWIEGERPGLVSRLFGRNGAGAPISITAMVDRALRSAPSVDAIEWYRLGPAGEELDHAGTPI